MRGEAVLTEKEQNYRCTGIPKLLPTVLNLHGGLGASAVRGRSSDSLVLAVTSMGQKVRFIWAGEMGGLYPSDKNKQVIHQDSEHKEPDGHSIDLLWTRFTQAIESGKRSPVMFR